MITTTRKIEFDAAHRVMEHESKCKNLHGHRYVIEASFTSKELDSLGRVVDFGVIKDLIKSWVDKNWDHNTILHEDDKKLGQYINKVTNQEIFYLPYNPTSENMAKYLFEEIIPELFSEYDIECIFLKLNETPNCFSSVS